MARLTKSIGCDECPHDEEACGNVDCPQVLNYEITTLECKGKKDPKTLYACWLEDLDHIILSESEIVEIAQAMGYKIEKIKS